MLLEATMCCATVRLGKAWNLTWDLQGRGCSKLMVTTLPLICSST